MIRIGNWVSFSIVTALPLGGLSLEPTQLLTNQNCTPPMPIVAHLFSNMDIRSLIDFPRDGGAGASELGAGGRGLPEAAAPLEELLRMPGELPRWLGAFLSCQRGQVAAAAVG